MTKKNNDSRPTELESLEDEEAATPNETRETYLGRSKSGYTKLRRSFIQSPPTNGSASKGSQPGTLALFNRNHRAVVLYLAVLANWPWLSREDMPLPAEAWIRFLTCDDPKGLTWTPQSLSHAWGVLEQLGLIVRPPKGRLREVQPRREDGRGEYVSPGGKDDSYLIIPNHFWTQQLHGTLSWPGLVVLLILLKETGLTPTAELPIDRAKAWYGISRTTAEGGLSELRRLGLLDTADRRIKDVDAPGGRRLTAQHTLLGPYSTKAREELRVAARNRVSKRAATPQFNRREESDDKKSPPKAGG